MAKSKSSVTVIKSRDTYTEEKVITGFKSYKYDPVTSISVVMKNIIAKTCVDEVMQNTFGMGFDKADKNGLLKFNLLSIVDKDLLRTGNGYIEVVCLDSEIIELYHVPVQLMYIKDVVSEKKIFVQNPITSTKSFDEFSLDALMKNKGKKSFILHVFNYEDDVNYGTPYWIAAMSKLKQSNNADAYNDAYFENDAQPSGVFWTKGMHMKKDQAEVIKDMLRQNKGVDNKCKLMNINMDDSSAELGFLRFNENVIDGAFLNLMARNEINFCIAFRVPPKKIGIETAGKLGGGNELQTQLNAFYEDFIIPRQMFWEEIFLNLFGEEVKLKRPVIVKISQTNNNEIVKSEKDVVAELVKFRESLIA